MDKLSAGFLVNCVRCAAIFSALAVPQLARADGLPIPLNSKDPNNKILVLDDQTWVYTDQAPLNEQTEQTGARPVSTTPGVRIGIPAHHRQYGPVTLVIDYAAPRPDSDALAIVEVGIECYDELCPIPIDQTMVGMRAAYMGEGVIEIGADRIKTWVARESRSYDLPNGAVAIAVQLRREEKLAPQAIRVRAIYGEHDRSALPGQQTRGALLFKILGGLLAFGGLIYWLAKREQ